MILLELVKMRNFNSDKIMLVRHQDPLYDVNLLYKKGFIETYQSIQSKDIFKNCDYIMSFIGTEATKAKYIGTYRVLNCVYSDINTLPVNFPYPEYGVGNYYRYSLERIQLLEDLEDRLVIEWGKSTRSWYQWLKPDKPKHVVEILPKGYVHEFVGFDNVLLTFEELELIVNNPDANRTWHTMLSSAAGVYLIVDRVTGNQYIGSAYGEKGLLGRWTNYVKTRHGGNKELIKSLEDEPLRYKNFTYSILRTLPRTMTAKEVIAVEQKYKEILGSRAFGLNSN